MTANRSPRPSETGSAYIVTLLALVVLTILALALAMVTQTEVQVGANEKTINRTFYAADSGLGQNEHGPRRLPRLDRPHEAPPFRLPRARYHTPAP